MTELLSAVTSWATTRSRTESLSGRSRLSTRRVSPNRCRVGRWRVVRAGERTDRRPLEERIADIIAEERLQVGAAFPSASALAERFGVSPPTVTRALDNLEAVGVLAGGGQGRVRTVRPRPIREERS
ncbi:GntR family transcriptional regulator [Streptomyces sp. NPDC003703]|uniref:GntR family transcriptional regulator n=1 Tax=Streptomyces sp. NPDC003283 TaxID=3364681 RepID=UPI0036CF1ABB